MEVVITRAPDEARPFAQALSAGTRAICMPVTAVVAADPDQQRALVAAARDLGGYHHLFVASRHAVTPLVAALAEAGVAPSAAPPVTAVGPATEAALRRAGFAAAARGNTGDDAAAALIATGLTGARVLAPRAAGGRDAPLDRLRGAGATVDALVAYRTAAVAPDDPSVAEGRAALLDGRAAACLLFAPSQVDAVLAVLGDGGLAALARVALVAIGPTTAAALRARGLTAAAVADAPTPAAMAKAVAAVYPGSR